MMGWEGPATWRQLETWRMWLKAQWNEPSRTDHYLMQLTAEIRRGNAKDPAKVQDEHFKIKFTEKMTEPQTSPLSPEDRTKISRSVWGPAIHGKNRKLE